MYITSEFAVYTVRLVLNAASPDVPEEPHLPEDPVGRPTPHAVHRCIRERRSAPIQRDWHCGRGNEHPLLLADLTPTA